MHRTVKINDVILSTSNKLKVTTEDGVSLKSSTWEDMEPNIKTLKLANPNYLIFRSSYGFVHFLD